MGESRRWAWQWALGAYVIFLALDVLLVAVLPHRVLVIGIGSLALDTAMLLMLGGLYRRRPFAAGDLGIRSTSGPPAVGLTFAAVIAYFVFGAVWAFLVIGLRRHQIAPQLHASVAGTVVAGLALCLVAPVTEELFFRGFIYRALRNRMGVSWSVAIAAALFAVGHATTYPADTLPVKAAFGVLACLLYERTGSLFPGIALHVLVDATGYEAMVSHGAIWIVPVAFLALGAIVLVRHRIRAPAAPTRGAYPESRPGAGDHPGTSGDAPIPMMPPWPPVPAQARERSDGPGSRLAGVSPRWWLGFVGGLLVLGVIAVNAVSHPTAHHARHSAQGAALGLIVIVGVAMILAALAWKLLSRPVHRP